MNNDGSHSHFLGAKKTAFRLVACSIGAILFPGVTALAQGLGDLAVTPTRVVLEGRARSSQLTLINRGRSAATYRISFVQMRMDTGGQLAAITEALPGERFSDALIRYAPRQVTLEPNVAQTVRLLLRKPPDLAAAEYRSHLLFRAVPATTAGSDIERLDPEGREIGIQLSPIYGVSIPIIVRHGELDLDLSVTELALTRKSEEGDNVLDFRLNRGGERSFYGDVTALFVPRSGGAETVVGEIKGVAVYTPNVDRRVRMRLHPPEGMTLARGKLKVLLREGPEVIAQAAYTIP